jgi:hypothetical protein
MQLLAQLIDQTAQTYTVLQISSVPILYGYDPGLRFPNNLPKPIIGIAAVANFIQHAR